MNYFFVVTGKFKFRRKIIFAREIVLKLNSNIMHTLYIDFLRAKNKIKVIQKRNDTLGYKDT